MTTQTDSQILERLLADESSMDDTPLRGEEVLEELNTATSIDSCEPMSADKPPVRELLDIDRSYQCYEQIRDGEEVKTVRALHPGDFLAVKMKRKGLLWNYTIVTEVCEDIIYAVCLCTPHLDPEKLKFVSDHSTAWKCFKDIFHSSPHELKVWEVPIQWHDVLKVLRYAHLSCEDIVEEARKELGESYSWKLRAKITEKIKFKLTQFIDGLKIDIDEKLSLKRFT